MELNLNLAQAKLEVMHLNEPYGKCHRCNYEELENENVDCPNCGAFNYNLKV